MIVIRQAREEDAPGIRDVFLASYDEDYSYPDFYDELGLKKLIFGDETLVLVAVDDGSGRVLGTASVMLESGAHTDLVGEFGRLAVHPDARRQGIAGMLLRERVERVCSRLHVGFMEARVAHRYSVDNALRHGFKPVGLVPFKDLFGTRRESIAYLVRYFEGALGLRRNHPRLIPEAYPLASAAMDSIGFVNDVVVDERSTPYTSEVDFEVERLTGEGYPSLLRIERGRLRRRELFGPMRLHYGFFKLKSASSNYLIARRDGHIVGAVGYTIARFERLVRVFELIALDDHVIRFLLEELLHRCQRAGELGLVEIDVSAYSPRMQRTLYELGFQPAAFVPALAFHRVERLDILKMVKLLVPFERDLVPLATATQDIAELVLRGFEQREVLPRLQEAFAGLELLEDLDEEQSRRLAAVCDLASFAPGEILFEEGDEADQLYILLEGRVVIDNTTAAAAIGSVGRGEGLGEAAMLTGNRHSARARACEPVVAGVLPRTALGQLVRRRPDIGVILYRNLACGLGAKLRRMDESVFQQVSGLR